MNELVTEYNRGYDEGLKEGLKAAEFSDSYWLRTYASAAMQGMLTNYVQDCMRDRQDAAHYAEDAVFIAQALLARVKKVEAQDE